MSIDECVCQFMGNITKDVSSLSPLNCNTSGSQRNFSQIESTFTEHLCESHMC